MGTPIVNLDTLIDTRVSANLDVQTTLEAKQDVLDAVVDAQAILDSVDTTVSAKKIVLNQHTAVKKTELDMHADSLESGLDVYGDGKVDEYDANALNRVTQYNDNHTDKLTIYNSNDAIKMSQYNANHMDRLEDINYAYADRIVQMLKTKRIMGMVDEYVAQTEEHMIPFLSTDDANYIYYGNGTLLELGVDYTIYDTTTIELVVKANPYDVITQINTAVLGDMLTAEGVLFEESIGVANGIAGLDDNGLVPSAQLPSYVDDVLEYATYADLPVEGETGKIYVVIADENSGDNTSSYRWTGSVYAMVSNTLTAADVKSLYESNLDTNAYTDAEKLKLAGIIDDTTASTLTAYSGSKVQEMHNAQAATIAALGTAQGEIVNTNTPVFASIPKYPLVGVLDFTTVVDSTNTSMFDIDSTNNLFAFKQAASYTFLSEVVIKSNVSAARVLTFRLVDSDTDVVLMTQSKNMIVASGNTENFSISTLLMVDVAPKNVRVEVSCSDTGYEFRSFNSILASSVGVGSESVDSIDTALGALVTGVLV